MEAINRIRVPFVHKPSIAGEIPVHVLGSW